MQQLGTSEIMKVDAEHGLVFGFAMISKDRQADGSYADHYDTQGHHIPEAEVLKASLDFMSDPPAPTAATATSRSRSR